jgi:Protein of unknown function (DUF742)
LSVSPESYGIDNPANDRDLTLIDGAEEITLDHLRDHLRVRHTQQDDEDDLPDEIGTDEIGTDHAGVAAEPASDTESADEWGEPADFRSVVRPYAWTRGRTRPVQDLAVETLVSTSVEGRSLTSICSAEHAAIVELCTGIRSVAEVAALLTLPLGVARVLLADMIDTGLVYVHRNPHDWVSGPNLSLLERILDGLHRL